MFNLAAVPRMYWLIVAVMLAALLFALLLVLRRREGSVAFRRLPPRSLGAAAGYLFRLVGFGLFTLILIAGVLLVYIDYQAVISETDPARRPVNLPADLPFNVEPVSFPGGGVQLAGWYVPSRNGAVIILLHGYGGTRAEMLWHAGVLVKAGYGVLLYDERASGESTGTYRSYGWEDAPDVGGAVAFLQDHAGDRLLKIGIAGCSIGGQIALQGAVHSPEIRAVWADGPANIVARDSPPPHNFLMQLTLASNYLIDAMYVWRLGIEAPAAMIDSIGQIAPRPVMLVGGGTEVGLFGSEAPRVNHFAAYAGPNAQVWVIPEATHCDGNRQVPEAYAQRLVEFFDGALHK